MVQRMTNAAVQHKRAVVLLSGGLDSTTAAALARTNNYDIFALTFDYVQSHRRELRAAESTAGGSTRPSRSSG